MSNDKDNEQQLTREHAAKAVGWAAIQAWSSRIVSLAVFIILARLLEPKDFGLVAMALIFVNLVQVLLDQSLGAAIIQRAELSDDLLHTAFWINILLGIVLLIVVAAMAGPIAVLMKEPTLSIYIRWLAVTFVFGALGSVHQAILTRRFGFKALAMRSMVATLLSGVVAVSLAWQGYGVWSLVIQNIIFAALSAVLVWVGCDWRPQFRFVWQHALQLWHFAVHTVAARIMDFFNSRILDLLVGYFFGPVLLGLYAVGYRLVMVLNQMTTQVTSQVSLSTFSRLQHEPVRLQRAFYEATQLTSLVAFPVFFGMGLLADSVVTVVFGAKWALAVPYLQILAFQGALFSVTYFFGTVLLALGKPSWWLALTVIDLVVRTFAVLMAIQYGALAVVAAYTIGAYATMPIGFILVQRLLGISLREYLCNYKAPILGTVAMVLGIFVLETLPVAASLGHGVKLVIGVIVGAATYLAGVALADLSVLKRVAAVGIMVIHRGGSR